MKKSGEYHEIDYLPVLHSICRFAGAVPGHISNVDLFLLRPNLVLSKTENTGASESHYCLFH